MSANSPTARLPAFWRRIRKELHAAYGGVCAYTCMYILPPGSVDHFLPASRFRNLAYEWSNYRFACAQANSYKGDSIEVIDPFLVRDGWFVIDFPSCLVRPAAHLPLQIKERIEKSIEVLQLNRADHFVQERCDIILEFLGGHLTLDFLFRRYPFLGKEIERKGGRDALLNVFRQR